MHMHKEAIGQEWGHFARILTFMDLPMRRKFQLYAVGALFWFVVSIGVAALALTLSRGTYNMLVDQYIPAERTAVAMRLQIEEINHATQRISMVEGLTTLDDASADASTALNKFDTLLAAYAERGPATNFFTTMTHIRAALAETVPAFTEAHRARLTGGALSPDLPRGEIQRLIVDAHTAIDRLSTQAALDYAEGADNIDTILNLSMSALVLLLILEVALLLLFTRWMMRAITRPLSLIQKQIHALRIGAVDLSDKIEIISDDEVGELSEAFNGLMETVHGMTQFKQVIEEDKQVDEIYARLADVFVNRLHINACHIFEVTEDDQRLRAVDIPEITAELSCNELILSQCELCRATHTGHRVSSFDFPGICRQFTGRDRFEHVCVPMISGGRTTGVIQLLFDPSQATPDEVGTQLFEAESYIDQSLSVIDAKRLMQKLRDTSLRDPLTGLYNRRYMQEVLEPQIAGVLRREKHVGLIMCDLDYFKRVNDEYGHDVGDTVLKETARILQESVREADVVIRFGGEEFIVLLFDIEPGEAINVAENIRTRIDNHRFQLDTGTLHKTISAGVSEYPHDTDSLWRAIKFADVALYQAKGEGRNLAMRFTPEMWTEEEF